MPNCSKARFVRLVIGTDYADNAFLQCAPEPVPVALPPQRRGYVAQGIEETDIVFRQVQIVCGNVRGYIPDLNRGRIECCRESRFKHAISYGPGLR